MAGYFAPKYALFSYLYFTTFGWIQEILLIVEACRLSENPILVVAGFSLRKITDGDAT